MQIAVTLYCLGENVKKESLNMFGTVAISPQNIFYAQLVESTDTEGQLHCPHPRCLRAPANDFPRDDPKPVPSASLDSPALETGEPY